MLEGELHTELAAGRLVKLTAGMSYQVANDISAHRSRTQTGAKLFIVDQDRPRRKGRNGVASINTPSNKRMQLTKLKAAPVGQAEVPPCAPGGGMDGGAASQLIRGVRRARKTSAPVRGSEGRWVMG